jgi:ABC-type lipoprotein export system ATPase subunit
MQVFTDLHRGGTTIVMVTHSQEVAAYTERVIDMRDGQIIRDTRNTRPLAAQMAVGEQR